MDGLDRGRVLSFVFRAFIVILLLNPEAIRADNATLVTSKEMQIEELMQIHVLDPSYKTPYDSLEIRGSEVLIRVWRDLPPNPNSQKIECLGYQWLLAGRGQRMGSGAKLVFEKFPEIDKITLEVVEVQFSTQRVDGRGKLKKLTTPRVYLRMSVQKSELSAMTTAPWEIKESLYRNNSTCLSLGRQYIRQMEISL